MHSRLIQNLRLLYEPPPFTSFNTISTKLTHCLYTVFKGKFWVVFTYQTLVELEMFDIQSNSNYVYRSSQVDLSLLADS